MQNWFNSFINRISPHNNIKEKANYYSNEIIASLLNNIPVREEVSYPIAGSFVSVENAMNTMIRTVRTKEYNVDISVYFEMQDNPNTNVFTLLQKTLMENYPNKSKKDFKITEKAVTVQFGTDTKINVCVIPLVLDETRPRDEWWGHLVLPNNRNKVLTCIPRHIQYVISRTHQTAYSIKFNHVIQLMKWWSKYHKLNLQSRDISIFTGYAFDRYPFSTDWFHTLDQVFSYYKKLYPVLMTAKDGNDQFIDPIINVSYIKNFSSYDVEKFHLITEETYNALYDAKIAYDYGNYKQALNYLQDIFGLEFQINKSEMQNKIQLAI